MTTLKIDFTTEDPKHSEVVVYLVESPPWNDLSTRLQSIEERIYLTIDAILDGHLQTRLRLTAGARYRVQVDAHDAPDQIEGLIVLINEHVQSHSDYTACLSDSSNASAIRVVSGRAMRRDRESRVHEGHEEKHKGH